MIKPVLKRLGWDLGKIILISMGFIASGIVMPHTINAVGLTLWAILISVGVFFWIDNTIGDIRIEEQRRQHAEKRRLRERPPEE